MTITPTYSGCPATDFIERNIREALDSAGYRDVIVETMLSPPWTTDWISDEGREKLRAYGIAPPQCGSDPGMPAGVLKFSRQAARHTAVPCPQCGSPNTTETSPFGSTACKALFKCLDCLEPFDYFKPY